MLLETLPITDVFFNDHGSITINIVETGETDVVTIESLVDEFLDFCADEQGVTILGSQENLNIAYNLLDSLHEAIARIEAVVYEDDDGDDFEVMTQKEEDELESEHQYVLREQAGFH